MATIGELARLGVRRARESYKHEGGGHDQKRHGWRYGQGAAAPIGQDAAEYIRRYNRRNTDYNPADSGYGIEQDIINNRADLVRVQKDLAWAKKTHAENMARLDQLQGPIAHLGNKLHTAMEGLKAANDDLAYWSNMRPGQGDPVYIQAQLDDARKRIGFWGDEISKMTAERNRLTEESREEIQNAKQIGRLTLGDLESAENRLREITERITGQESLYMELLENKKAEAGALRHQIMRQHKEQIQKIQADAQAEMAKDPDPDAKIETVRLSNIAHRARKKILELENKIVDQLRRRTLYQAPDNIIDIDTEAITDLSEISQPGKILSSLPLGARQFTSFVDNYLVSNMTPAKTIVEKLESGRAFFRNDDMTVHLDYRISSNVALVHELGHWFERLDPLIHMLAVNFLRSRIPDDEVISLYSFGEWVFKDSFLREYTGKIYANFAVTPAGLTGAQFKRMELDSTEVISVGLELLNQDPIRLMRDDPDYFDFIYAVTDI